jgi:hypothetical protein
MKTLIPALPACVLAMLASGSAAQQTRAEGLTR